MYTDWTAVALLLFTSVPLLAVVATATFFICQQRKKQLRGGPRLLADQAVTPFLLPQPRRTPGPNRPDRYGTAVHPPVEFHCLRSRSRWP